MNKLLTILFATLYLMMAQDAYAFNKSSISYSIKKSWSDNQYVYLLYDVENTLVHYNLTDDIEGTALKESHNSFYQKIDKKVIKNQYVIDLSKGIAANGLIYKDQDFDLREDEHGAIHVVTSNGQFNISCNRKLWMNSSPARFQDKLFYCGSIIPITNQAIVELPAVLEEYIKALANKVNPNRRDAPVVAAVASGRELLISTFSSANKKSVLLNFVSINIDTLENNGVTELPFSSNEYQVSNSFYGHDNHGLLIKPRDYKKRELHICDVEGCKKNTFTSGLSYVLVDESSHSLLIFQRRKYSDPKTDVFKNIMNETSFN